MSRIGRQTGVCLHCGRPKIEHVVIHVFSLEFLLCPTAFYREFEVVEVQPTKTPETGV